MDRPWGLAFCPHGNLTRKTQNGLTQHFSWDGTNRLTWAETEAGKTEYAYAL
ncbi:hypothetical protein [Chitinolyticbacter albus]|uniref:hypothetical protein n=1 Tax=Chitinolyticbacter albus TaxID=2961951 RepID=UPI00210EB6ED|nr:hypothetical protein [Chitinolyticbacter albus]